LTPKALKNETVEKSSINFFLFMSGAYLLHARILLYDGNCLCDKYLLGVEDEELLMFI
jgi:hypothetical protein